MIQPPPARPGMAEHEVDTPALLVDLDALEFNLDRMAALLAGTGVRLRAHAKTHKSPVIAGWQAARGAIGQCVQKVAEAEIMAWGGVANILVSNEVVVPTKLARLVALHGVAQVAVCADSGLGVDRIAAAAADAGIRQDVLIEIDAGHGRCGVAPGPAAVALAERVAASPHLRFAGLQAYHGAAQHMRSLDERTIAIGVGADGARRTVEQLRQRGLHCDIVGGGGTGSFEIEAASGVFTEIQAGSYCFMDADYGRNGGGASAGFHQSLFVLATVMSTRPGRAVVDAGHKAVAIDSGFPLVWGGAGVAYTGASDEHGVLSGDGDLPDLGAPIRLVPGHCDPTVDRHDWYVGVRGGRVEKVWPVAARGAMG